jgi:hypothetical protein
MKDVILVLTILMSLGILLGSIWSSLESGQKLSWKPSVVIPYGAIFVCIVLIKYFS